MSAVIPLTYFYRLIQNQVRTVKKINILMDNVKASQMFEG